MSGETSERYPHALSPIAIGSVEVRNRVFMPAHGLGLVSGGPHGSKVPSQEAVHYYRERAAGGVGLLYFSSCINPRDALASPYYADGLPAWQAVAEAVHEHGAALFGQLSYYYNHRSAWEPLAPSAPVLGVSGYTNFQFHHTCRQMSTREVERLVDAHARCARTLVAAGFDGIEIHAAHGMLVEQFLSPYFNKRTDSYGGDVDGRMRFLVETLAAVREVAGPDRAVGIRFNCDEMLPGGLTQDDTSEILSRLVPAGLLDFVNLDISVEPQQGPFMCAPQFMPPLHMAGFINNVGKAAGSSVVVMGTPGRLTTLAQAEEFVAEGPMQMVGAVRALIAEPNLVKNAAEGREDRNRTCTACNFCIASYELGAGWGCTVNPATGRESRWGTLSLVAAPRRGKVVVVGGGPAGLEAARVAALRGHEVVVFERSGRLGGQLALWAGLPNRDAHQATISWYERQLTELGVKLQMGAEASVQTVLGEQPVAVVVATGARYDPTGESGFMLSAIPGAELPFVYTPEQILEGGVRPRGRVLVLDEEGIHTAAGIAELLAADGAQVELMTREFQPMPSLFYSLESMFIIPRLRSYGVRVTTTSFIKEIQPGSATVFDIMMNVDEKRPVDAVVLATRRVPTSGLADALEALQEKVPQVFLVGDAASPRGLFEATYEGQRFARMVGEKNALESLTDAWFASSPGEVFAGFAPARPHG